MDFHKVCERPTFPFSFPYPSKQGKRRKENHSHSLNMPLVECSMSRKWEPSINICCHPPHCFRAGNGGCSAQELGNEVMAVYAKWYCDSNKHYLSLRWFSSKSKHDWSSSLLTIPCRKVKRSLSRNFVMAECWWHGSQRLNKAVIWRIRLKKQE